MINGTIDQLHMATAIPFLEQGERESSLNSGDSEEKESVLKPDDSQEKETPMGPADEA